MKKISESHKWGTSLTKFPWEKKTKQSHLEVLLASTLREWFNEKHRINCQLEIKLINSLPVIKCPFCNSEDFKKNGFLKSGIQKFKCLNPNCKKSFVALSNTMFDNHKIPISEWFEFILHLIAFDSISVSSLSNRNAVSTGYYWLKKLFYVLKDEQDSVILKDRIYLDEKFVSIECKTDNKSQKKLRGISRNKICIATAIDKHGNLFCKECGRGKPSSKRILDVFKNHITEGSIIVHDMEQAHNGIIQKYNLGSEEYKSVGLKNVKDKDNPLNPINQVHKYMKMFFAKHQPFDKNSLQNWLNLFHFIMSKPNNGYEKIAKIITKLVKFRGIIRYREKSK